MLGLLLSRLVKSGTLTVVGPNGRKRIYGQGAPAITMCLHDRRVATEIALRPELKLGEAYMDGRLTVENGDIADLVDLLIANLEAQGEPTVMKFAGGIRRLLRRLAQFNPAGRAQRNVAHHYDLSGELYDLFLDEDRQYSCAYFETPDETLEDAQTAKKRHIAAKLHLDRQGLKVLDIGSGWGGLALDLACDCGASVLGVTLSREQLARARDRARKAGLSQRCSFELRDYRALTGKFDRIVSVGMFEHVGVPHYRAFFAKLRDLLADDGVALIHTIGRLHGPGASNPWITKYIFPGGYTPALSEVLPAIEREGLMTTDVETLRLHYAYTLRAWRERFRANWDKAAAIYDERFCRMWDFYLGAMEVCFRRQGLVVFQIQVTKAIDALPVMRDYMVDDERSMRFAGTDRMPQATKAA